MTAKQLTDSILQMAIQGKLVPQDPNDEPASVLLERIRKEKARLVKEGKLKKKDLEVKPISKDEIPFEIPEGWEWVRLMNIGIAETGTTPSKSHPEYFGTFIPFLGPANILNGQIISETQGLSEIGANYGRIVPKGSILQVCIGGSIGKCAIVDKPVTFNQQINSITPLVCVIEFIYYVLQSDYFRLAIKEKSTGTATPIINRGNWEQLAIPLPPLAEQHRIVEKIEEFLPVIKEYGVAYDEASKMDEVLPDKLKKSILQEAIVGKLGTQDPSDAPASCLLDEIRAEKQKLVEEGVLKKKDLVETPVEENEKPFDIPESWEWVRVGFVAEYINGLAFKPEDWETTGIPIIRIQNLTDYNRPCNYTTKSFDEKFKVKKGDLLFSWSATLDSFIWEGKTAWLNQHIFKVNPYTGIYKKYLYYALKAIVVKFLGITHGLTMKHLTRGVFEGYPFALPPLAEQHRIVQKIEELYAEIDKMTINNIKTNINEKEETKKE